MLAARAACHPRGPQYRQRRIAYALEGELAAARTSRTAAARAPRRALPAVRRCCCNWCRCCCARAADGTCRHARRRGDRRPVARRGRPVAADDRRAGRAGAVRTAGRALGRGTGARGVRRARARQHRGHLAPAVRGARARLRGSAPGVVQRERAIGLRLRTGGDGTVLLSRRPQGLSRSVVLRRTAPALRRAGRFRAGLRDRPRGGPSRADADRHLGAGAGAPAAAPRRPR